MVRASGIGFNFEDENDDEHLVLPVLLEPRDGALPEVAAVKMTAPGTFVVCYRKELGEGEIIAVCDAALHFYDLRMAELDASCNDDLALGLDDSSSKSR